MAGHSKQLMGVLNTQIKFMKAEEEGANLHPLPEEGTESLELRRCCHLSYLSYSPIQGDLLDPEDPREFYKDLKPIGQG